MNSRARTISLAAALFAGFHIIAVALPVLISGGAGESQAFATALFDLPLHWALELFASGLAVLYGSSHALYIWVFAVGGTLMYAALGALLGAGIHAVARAFRAA